MTINYGLSFICISTTLSKGIDIIRREQQCSNLLKVKIIALIIYTNAENYVLLQI